MYGVIKLQFLVILIIVIVIVIISELYFHTIMFKAKYVLVVGSCINEIKSN